MLVKVNIPGSPEARYSAGEDKLGCWRVWAKTKGQRKVERRNGHMMLGPYPLDSKR